MTFSHFSFSPPFPAQPHSVILSAPTPSHTTPHDQYHSPVAVFSILELSNHPSLQLQLTSAPPQTSTSHTLAIQIFPPWQQPQTPTRTGRHQTMWFLFNHFIPSLRPSSTHLRVVARLVFLTTTVGFSPPHQRNCPSNPNQQLFQTPLPPHYISPTPQNPPLTPKQ
jgi:hypothetical protein